MTVKKYIREKGWQFDCKKKPFRAMNVQIGFEHDGIADETEFSIDAYDATDLSNLFDAFCAENGFDNDTVLYVTVAEVASTMEELS